MPQPLAADGGNWFGERPDVGEEPQPASGAEIPVGVGGYDMPIVGYDATGMGSRTGDLAGGPYGGGGYHSPGRQSALPLAAIYRPQDGFNLRAGIRP